MYWTQVEYMFITLEVKNPRVVILVTFLPDHLFIFSIQEFHK